MILQALRAYYDRLASDPDVEISPIGFSRQKISFCVVLNDDGTLHEIIPENDGDPKKPRPKLLIVPGGAKPPGQGINPCFLWDNTGYMLGFKPDDDNPERSRETFEAFRDRHLELKEAIDDPEFAVVCQFLFNWDPSRAAEHETLAEITTGFGVFRIRKQPHYVHEREAVRNWWEVQQAIADENQVTGQCLLTGEVAPLARLHEPKIKGVSGAQSAGASIVSFNDSAYESFGRSQSFNAPVSEIAAFQYGTALNHLLRSGGGKRIQIGDATTVFWTESPSPAEELFGFIADPESAPAEDESQKSTLRTLLQRIANGEQAEDLELGDADTPFYVLGLSPNAARISIRFWYVGSVKELIDAIRQHFMDIEVPCADFEKHPAFWKLIRQTARENKDVSPLLGGSLMRSVLQKSPYPPSLMNGVIRRIQADRDVNGIRAAIIKGTLTRCIESGTKPAIKVDASNRLQPYVIGRLCALIEWCEVETRPQKDKNRWDTTLRDRHLVGVMNSPTSMIVYLLRRFVHHQSKVSRRGDISNASELARSIQWKVVSVMQHLPCISGHMTTLDKAWFILGYYQENRSKQDNVEHASETKEKPMPELSGPNESHCNPVYHAGRLLAVCQEIQRLAQRRADRDVGRTYADSYFASASGNPKLLCHVWKIARHRLSQVDHWGVRRELENLATRIVNEFGDKWAASSGLDDQSDFQLGYFQQHACLPSEHGDKRYRTNDGLNVVKSVGEKRVADTLFELGARYEYERPIEVPDAKAPFKPDFSVDSEDGNHTLIIEYTGLIGDEKYDAQWNFKSAGYRRLPAPVLAEVELLDERPRYTLLQLTPSDVRSNERIRALLRGAIAVSLGTVAAHPEMPF